MSAVTVRRPAKPAKVRIHPHATVVSAAGALTLGTTDSAVTYSGLGSNWVSVDRPGTSPLARRATRGRLQAKLTAMLIGGYHSMTVDEQLLTLDRIGASSATVGVAFGEMSRHRWHLTGIEAATIDRAPMTNEAQHTNVTLTFLVAIDEALTVAVSRGPKPASDKGKRAHGTTTVRKGETISKVAARVYGNANRWPEIAKLNKIRDPRRIRVGQKLRY